MMYFKRKIKAKQQFASNWVRSLRIKKICKRVRLQMIAPFFCITIFKPGKIHK